MRKLYIIDYGKNKFLKVNDLEAELFFTFDNEVVNSIEEATKFESVQQASFFNERTTYNDKSGVIRLCNN